MDNYLQQQVPDNDNDHNGTIHNGTIDQNGTIHNDTHNDQYNRSPLNHPEGPDGQDGHERIPLAAVIVPSVIGGILLIILLIILIRKCCCKKKNVGTPNDAESDKNPEYFYQPSISAQNVDQINEK